MPLMKNRRLLYLLLAMFGVSALTMVDASAATVKKQKSQKSNSQKKHSQKSQKQKPQKQKSNSSANNPAISAKEEPLLKAEALIKAGKPAAAYALLAPLEAGRSGEARFDNLLGIAALDSGKPDKAALAFKRVLEVTPDSAGARLDLARAYYQLGDLPHARTEFQAVMKQSPSDAAKVTIQKYLDVIAQKIPVPQNVAATQNAPVPQNASVLQKPATEAQVAVTQGSTATASGSSTGIGANTAAADGNTALVRIERFQVKGNMLLDAGLIERLLAPFKGDAKSYSDIQLALEGLEGAYRNAGYSAVHVVTPEQEITEGIVTFQVIESVIGKVTLSGNEHYDKNNIRNALPALAEGYTPSARELSENIRLANENPTRQMDVVLAIGEEENTIDAKINVQDSSPRKVFVTLENTGSESTGMYRTGVGMQHNNLFNRDHAATLSYTTSPNHVSDVKQYSASYRLPLYALGDSVDLIAAYSDTNAGTTSTVAGPLTFSGKGRVYSARYNHYLPRQGEYLSKIIGGLDYRAYINNCSLGVFGAAGCGSAAFDVTVHPVSVAYNGTLTKPAYVADFTTTLVRNIPGGPKGGSADFNAVRPSPVGGAGANAEYTILRLNGSLTGVLPQEWQYRLAGNAQYTRDALVSGESFGLVGATAVRGFIEREVFSSDKGYVFNVELYTPELSQKLNMQNGSFRLLGFVDRASGWNEPLAGDSVTRNTAGSVGMGFRFSYGKHLTTRFDYARVTEATGTSKVGDQRGHIGLVGSW